MFHTITLQDVRTRGSKSIPRDVTSFLIVNSKPIAAIVPMEEYALLEQLREDREDRLAIEERRDEKPVPFTSLSVLKQS